MKNIIFALSFAIGAVSIHASEQNSIQDNNAFETQGLSLDDENTDQWFYGGFGFGGYGFGGFGFGGLGYGFRGCCGGFGGFYPYSYPYALFYPRTIAYIYPMTTTVAQPAVGAMVGRPGMVQNRGMMRNPAMMRNQGIQGQRPMQGQRPVMDQRGVSQGQAPVNQEMPQQQPMTAPEDEQ